MNTSRYLEIDLVTADLEELKRARDQILKALDKKVEDLTKGVKKPSSPKLAVRKVEKPSPRGILTKKPSYGDTVLVKNIPEAILTPKKIIKEFSKFGNITRLQILRDEDGEILDSAYLVFEDPEVAEKLIENKYPFKNSRDDKRRIVVSAARPLRPENDSQLDSDIF